MQRHLRGSLLIAALSLAAPALAHHPGGVGNSAGAGPANTIPATTLEAGQIAAFVIYEYIGLGGLGDAALVGAAGRHEHAHSIGSIQSTSFGAAFGLTDDLSLYARLPYVVRTDIREGSHSHVHGGGAVNSVTARGGTEGLGDATLLGQWRFLDDEARGFSAAALFGVKLPTGRTDARDRAGALFEAEFQPGSGSTDLLAGLAVTQRLGGAWALSASALYVFVNTGVQSTNLGDRFQYNAALSYRLFGPSADQPVLGAAVPVAYAHAGHSHAAPHAPLPEVKAPPRLGVDLVLEANGEWHDRQRIAGAADPNSGGNVVYLSPGLRISGGNASGFVSVGLPVVNDVNGLQSRPGHRVVTGVALAF